MNFLNGVSLNIFDDIRVFIFSVLTLCRNIKNFRPSVLCRDMCVNIKCTLTVLDFRPAFPAVLLLSKLRDPEKLPVKQFIVS